MAWDTRVYIAHGDKVNATNHQIIKVVRQYQLTRIFQIERKMERRSSKF